jgi:hypothetical protein
MKAKEGMNLSELKLYRARRKRVKAWRLRRY